MEYSLDLDVENVCRICLQTKEKLISLFTVQIVDGEFKAMPVIIESCFGIQIKNEEFLPLKMCGSCKSTIIDFYNFKVKFLRSEDVLRKAFYSQTVEEDSSSQIETTKEFDEKQIEIEPTKEIVLKAEHPEPEFEDEPLANDDEGEEFTTEEIVFDENEDFREVEIDSITCDDERFAIFSADGEDIGDEASELAPIDEESVSDRPPSSQSAVETDGIEEFKITTLDPKDLSARPRKRARVSRPTVAQCTICLKKHNPDSDEFKLLHDALLVLSDNCDFLRCHRCLYTFHRDEDLQNHRRVVHHEEPSTDNKEENLYTDIQYLEEDDDFVANLTCGVCQNTFSSSNSLKCHMSTHLDVFNCPIDNCGYQYTSYVSFTKHVQIKHHSGENLTCRNCKQEGYPSIEELHRHYKTSCPIKFQCEKCDKFFSSEKSLQAHVKYRHSKKKFTCELCGKTFAQLSELEIHSRSHTGVRPFACTICGNTYKTASMRATHMDSHNQISLACPICSKVLRSRRCYTLHIRRHTEEKKHKCEKCGKMFHTKWHVKNHASKMHKEG